MDWESSNMMELRHHAEVQRVPAIVKRLVEILNKKSMGIDFFDGLYIQRKVQFAALASGNNVEAAVMAITWIQDFRAVRVSLDRIERELNGEQPYNASSFEPLAATKNIEEEIEKNVALYGDDY